MAKIRNRLQLLFIPLMTSALTALFCGLELFSNTKYHLPYQIIQYVPSTKYHFQASFPPKDDVLSVIKDGAIYRSNSTQIFDKDEETKLLLKDLKIPKMRSKLIYLFFKINIFKNKKPTVALKIIVASIKYRFQGRNRINVRINFMKFAMSIYNLAIK